MLRLTQDEFIILACLADYNLTAYEILGFAKDLTYMIPLENLFPTIEHLIEIGLIKEHVGYIPSFGTTNPLLVTPIHMQKFELTQNGTDIVIEEMRAVDLLVKRVRKEVRKLQQ
jgi:hypothetical protein